MKLPRTAYTDQPWRIHELTRDFRVEDVWSFRTPGAGPDDFPTMLAAMRAAGGPGKQSAPVRFLFAARWKIGALFGWDEPKDGLAARVSSLRDRLPDDLRDSPGPESEEMPLTPVYELDTECARELANKTVHTIMHLAWVPTASGDHELRMAVLVKPNGTFGRLYMAAIAPFRHLVVYPALTRQWERAWREYGRAKPEGGRPAGTVDGVVGRHDMPPSFHALTSMPDFDYGDVFTLATEAATDATPEQWARAMFGDVPGTGERLIWRGLLGLRLTHGRSPDTVAGWRVAERGPDWIRLATASPSLTADLVVRTSEGRVSLATFLRYERTPGRLIWPPLSAVHRRLVPGVLRDAASRIR
ncbi:DUF2867 domain-containing protein [Embleya hyalina]|uniref:DUF2867 domain-containing protein n=1 Tax=Embleya hyalina TaxID=516124 RepID=A0A401YF75_9ACTN|nr:hypothetical protein EHYA_00909 [Embleya hyalina]